MAILMQDETHRLICKSCGSKTFYEQFIYGYTKENDDLIATLDSTVIKCSHCNKVAKKLKPGKSTIKR